MQGEAEAADTLVQFNRLPDDVMIRSTSAVDAGRPEQLMLDSVALRLSLSMAASYGSSSTVLPTDCYVGAAVPGILYVSSFKDITRGGQEALDAAGISGFVSVARELEAALPPGVSAETLAAGRYRLKVVPLTDDGDTKLGESIDDIFTFIDEHHSATGRASIIYCQAGKSRSVSFALAYMIREYKINVEGALDMLRRSGYGRADPNICFLAELKALEHQLRAQATPAH